MIGVLFVPSDCVINSSVSDVSVEEDVNYNVRETRGLSEATLAGLMKDHG